jgi:hypothetical protein
MSFEIDTSHTENINTNYDDLSQIRDSIEIMNKFNQVEILRILTKHNNVTINENKYGIHINLSELNPQIINELRMYINYVNTQEIQLNNTEKQKESFKNTFFVKEVKDNASKNVSNEY